MHPVPAHPAERRLEPHHAAKGRRPDDRPRGLTAERSLAHPRREGRAGAAARSPGGVVERPRVSSRGRIGPGKLRRVGLAEDDRAGCAQAGDGDRVGWGHDPRHDRRPAGGLDAGGVEDVLDAEGNPVQRAYDRPRTLELREPAGLAPRVLGPHARPGLNPRLHPFDPAKGGLDQVDGAQAPVGDQRGDLAQGQVPGLTHRECPGAALRRVPRRATPRSGARSPHGA